MTNYEFCPNRLNFERYDQKFYDEYLKSRLDTIDLIIFKNLYGEYNSRSMGFPIEIKLLNENKCRQIMQKEFCL